MSKGDRSQTLNLFGLFFSPVYIYIVVFLPGLSARSGVSQLQFLRAGKDKQETAQWLASPSTIRAILEACLSRVSSLKGQSCIVHHRTMYEGNLEKVGVD